jgi:hypothetical protein
MTLEFGREEGDGCGQTASIPLLKKIFHINAIAKSLSYCHIYVLVYSIAFL